MSTFHIAVLGAIAGFTIFLGLPVGRVRGLPAGTRALLNATATGVLLFLFWDVLVHAVEPVETALVAVTQDGTGTWTGFISLAAVFVAALVLGLMTLVYYEQWMAGAKGTSRPHGPTPKPPPTPYSRKLDGAFPSLSRHLLSRPTS